MMKKSYEKPMILVESFQLDAAVAISCASGTALNHYEDSCGYGISRDPDFPFAYFANEDICANDLSLWGDDDNSTVCYHGPYGELNGIIFIYS